MKKIGLGTRPSEIKKRDKELDLSDSRHVKPPPKNKSPKKPHVMAAKARTGNFFKPALIAIISLAAGILLAGFIFFDFSFKIAMDHARLISGEQELAIKAGESFNVRFSQGLKFKKVVFKGFYRLFPPGDTKLTVDNIPGTVNLFNRDIIPLLRPEERTSYDILISKDDQILGKISFTLDMDARGWILRADAVEDKKIKTACFKKAIAVNPDSAEAHIALGRIYESEKKTSKAISEYESAAGIDPGNLPLLKSLLSLYKKKGRSSKLIKTYERLAGVDVQQADKYFYEAGIIAEKKGALDKAKSLYRKGLSGNRANIFARQRLIKIYESGKEWKRVAANTRVLLEYDSKNPELYLYLSHAYLQTGNLSGAAAAAQKAEKFNPTDLSIHLQLAHIFERSQKYDKAVEYYQKAVKKDKKNAPAYNRLALLLEKRGKIKKALQNYKKAVSLRPGDVDYCINLADAYEKNKQWKKAAEMYAKVISLDKNNKGAWEALAILYIKTKKKWKALEAYLKLSKFEPKKVLWHLKTAVLYEQLGKLDKAKQAYKTIMQLDPANKDAKQRYVEISKMIINKKLQ